MVSDLLFDASMKIVQYSFVDGLATKRVQVYERFDWGHLHFVKA